MAAQGLSNRTVGAHLYRIFEVGCYLTWLLSHVVELLWF
jgi:hypothetical protein